MVDRRSLHSNRGQRRSSNDHEDGYSAASDELSDVSSSSSSPRYTSRQSFSQRSLGDRSSSRQSSYGRSTTGSSGRGRGSSSRANRGRKRTSDRISVQYASELDDEDSLRTSNYSSDSYYSSDRSATDDAKKGERAKQRRTEQRYFDSDSDRMQSDAADTGRSERHSSRAKARYGREAESQKRRSASYHNADAAEYHKKVVHNESVEASHRRRSSTSIRESYGHASDYTGYDRDNNWERFYDDGSDRARRARSDLYLRSRSHRKGGGVLASLPFPLGYVLPVLILIVIVVLILFVGTSVFSCATSSQEEAVLEASETEPIALSYTASITALDSIEEESESSITTFTLADEDQSYMPTLSDDAETAIEAALEPFTENDYDVGFLVLDLQTGSGFCYNIDTEIYGASSIKGPVLIYGCQEALETGKLSISSVESYASNAIIYSDNTAYYNMRSVFEQYADTSFESWLESIDVDTSLASDTSFPHYSVRNSAKLWMDTYLYFTSDDSDPDIVSWVQDLMSQTQVSMLRSGVDTSFALVTDGGDVYYDDGSSDDDDSDSSEDSTSDSSADDSSSNIVVYDKAGWINGSSDDAICDAGLVIEGDNVYLISVMTGAPDGDANRESVMNLIGTLWAQRSALVPDEDYVIVDSSASSSSDSDASDGS